MLEKLNPNTTVLTANSRLTRYLLTEFDQQQATQHKTAWETPTILPLQNWLEAQFHQTNISGAILLSDFQEECVWQEIISQSSLAPELLQPAQMAKLVKKAFEYFLLWQVSLDELEPFTEQLEVRCLVEWIVAFQKHCATKNWITHAQLPALLLTCDLQLPPKIILVGFDDLNPALRALLAAIEKKCVIETENIAADTLEKNQLILDDQDAEIKTMAQWASAQLEKNPRAKIGCVIPDLGKMHTHVQRIFAQIIDPEKINISAGSAISQHHMIYTALTVLNWCHSDLPIESLASILQSPYLCLTEDEKNFGAQIDALLREQNKMRVSMSDLFCSRKSGGR